MTSALASSLTEAGPLILQAFAWDMAPDSSHWRYLAQHAQEIADLGVTIIWLPPAFKGQAGINDVGYGVYDLYDLGEFDQKGAVPTKYGTKDEYLAAIDALHEAGIAVAADIVLNHRMGADASETVLARRSTRRSALRPSANPRPSKRGPASPSPAARGPTRISPGTGRASTASTGMRPPSARACGSSRASSGTSPSTRSLVTTTT